MKVRDYMTKKVFTIREDKKVFIALGIMNWAHIRHVPVVDCAGRLLGTISYCDILQVSISSISTQVANLERKQHLWSISLENVMQTNVQTISPNDSVQEAAKIMREKNSDVCQSLSKGSW